VPEQVSVAMTETAADMPEGLLALALDVGAGLQARALLEALAKELDKTHPGAAGQPPRGSGRDPDRAATGRTAHARSNPAVDQRESMISICREHAKNVNAGETDRWRCAGAPQGWSRRATSFAA
jgi:hypothetical protein